MRAYPGVLERMILGRDGKRGALLQATEAELAPIKTAVEAGRLRDPAKIGIRVGRVINKHKVAKHLVTDIAEGHFGYHRDQVGIDAVAALDGIYVLRSGPSGRGRGGVGLQAARERTRLPLDQGRRPRATLDLARGRQRRRAQHVTQPERARTLAKSLTRDTNLNKLIRSHTKIKARRSTTAAQRHAHVATCN